MFIFFYHIFTFAQEHVFFPTQCFFRKTLLSKIETFFQKFTLF